MASHVSVRYRTEKSIGGFNLSVLKSALQKYIRRGETVKALQAVREFHSFSLATDDVESGGRLKSIRTNYVHRLMVITLEDIGDVEFAAQAFPMLDKISQFSFGGSITKELESNFVMLACSWPKSRSGSHAKAVASIISGKDPLAIEMARKYFPQIGAAYVSVSSQITGHPSHEWPGMFERALVQAWREPSEQSTAKALMFGWMVANCTTVLESHPSYPRKKKPFWVAMGIIDAFCGKLSAGVPGPNLFANWAYVCRNYVEHLEKLTEKHLCWLLPVLAICHMSPKFPKVAPATIVPPFTDEMRQKTSRGAMVLDSYVIDLHTGKRSKDSLTTFAQLGSVVKPEVPPSDSGWREFYNARKEVEDSKTVDLPRFRTVQFEGPPPHPCLTETKKFSLVLRTQLVTGKGKTDVYFAHDIEAPEPERFVVVKGPLPEAQAQYAVYVDRAIKGKLGLPFLDNGIRIKYLCPDRWPEGTPLGSRNAIKRNTPCAFLVARSWIAEKDLATRMHSSKLWPPTIVCDWEAPSLKKHQFHVSNWKTYRPLVREMYVKHVLLRWALAIGDCADRNFLVINSGTERECLVGFDEDCCKRGADGHIQRTEGLASDLKSKKCALVLEWIAENEDATVEYLLQLEGAVCDASHSPPLFPAPGVNARLDPRDRPRILAECRKLFTPH